MKKFWHTGTLFKQNWNWKYKWSYKFDFCTECKTCNSKHKGHWLCTKCFDKKRDLNKKRQETKKKAGRKYHDIHYKPVLERKKQISTFNFDEYRKKWYNENKERISIESKGKKRFKKWLPCLTLRFWEKTIHLPFETLSITSSTSSKQNIEQYEMYKKVREFYEK